MSNEESHPMSEGLSAAQLKELKDMLLARRKALTAEMDQNIENLAPPEVNAGSVSQDENARLRINNGTIERLPGINDDALDINAYRGYVLRK